MFSFHYRDHDGWHRIEMGVAFRSSNCEIQNGGALWNYVCCMCVAEATQSSVCEIYQYN
jgi:hypothetical protein